MKDIIYSLYGCQCLALVLSVVAFLGVKCLLFILINNKVVRLVLYLLSLFMFVLQASLFEIVFDFECLTITMLCIFAEILMISWFVEKKIVELIDYTIARTREK